MTIPRNLSFLAEGASSTGVLGVANGGSGATTLTGYLIGNGTGAFTTSATIPTSALSGTISLTTQVSGILPIANGGTAQSSFTANQIHYGSFSTSAGLTFDGTNFATTGYASATSFRPTSSTVPTNGMYLPASNAVGISTNSTERLRIASTGIISVNSASTVASSLFGVAFDGSGFNGFGLNDSAAASGTGYIYFQSNGTTIGSIARVASTSAVVYNTTSDERLKTNIADASPVLDKLMDVKVRQYDWIDGDLHQDAGFIAQELEPILSGIVTKGKTEEDMWQLDYARLTPYLVKAMQEQQTLIELLTQRIAILEAK